MFQFLNWFYFIFIYIFISNENDPIFDRNSIDIIKKKFVIVFTNEQFDLKKNHLIAQSTMFVAFWLIHVISFIQNVVPLLNIRNHSIIKTYINY